MTTTILQSKAVFGNGKNILSCRVTVTYTSGTLQFYVGVSSSPTTPPTVWQEVTVTSGVEEQVTLEQFNTWLYYKIVKDTATVVKATKNSYGRFTAPGVRIREIVTE